ncbi:MAG: hypothetical protein LDL41_03290 [Coleofasciculus sp. S288]|nr:hypothetical protein [Coleofasciculus sp. S288]
MTHPIPTVLFHGLGCDSSSILVELIYNPTRRKELNIDLERLVVATAQTGLESKLIKRQNEKFIYPLLKKHNVRVIQIAKAGLYTKDGYEVLSDGVPEICYIEGAYTLADELLTTGTVPNYSKGKRRCSDKYKAKILRAWTQAEYGNRPIQTVFGYNADEQYRIQRAEPYIEANHHVIYPLMMWGWHRNYIEQYMAEFAGERFYRSACTICPFAKISGSKQEILLKYQAYPEEAAEAALIEYTARCLNPRQSLYPNGRTVEQFLENNGLTIALSLFEEKLASCRWGVYRVRRIYKKIAYRAIECVMKGTRSQCNNNLFKKAQDFNIPLINEGGIDRLYLERKEDGFRCEEYFVVCPNVVDDKQRKSFENQWCLSHIPNLFELKSA